MKKAIVGGSLVLDITMGLENDAPCAIEELFRQGKLTYLSDVSIYLGGCVGNTGIGMHKLGVPVKLFSKLGNDVIGSIAESILREYGVNADISVVQDQSSACGIAITPPGMDKISFFKRGASQKFTADDISREEFVDADLFHFGYPSSMSNMYSRSGEGFLRLVRKAKQEKITVSIDMSMPDLKSDAARVNWMEILTTVLPYVDIFVPSIEETLFMMDHDQYMEMVKRFGSRNIIDHIDMTQLPEIADRLLGMGAKIVLLKLGSKGMYLRTSPATAFEGFGRALPNSLSAWEDCEIWKPAMAVDKIMSVTGAGDTAIAGFLSALLRSDSPEKAMQMAALSAYLCITSLDTVGKLRPMSEMDEMATAECCYNEIHLPGEWKWHADGAYYARK